MRDNGPLWIGLDLGTQSVKASAIDGAGTLRASASSPLRSTRTAGRHEQDAHEWISASRAAILGLGAKLSAADMRGVKAVSICSTSGTVCVVDERGQAHSPGLMYDDVRGAPYVAEIADADPELWQSLGYRIQASWGLAKIVWLIRHGKLRAGDHIAHQNDVVASAMSGDRVASDWSSALKSGYDLRGERWSDRACAALGITDYVLPDVVAPGTLIGHVAADWADATGLQNGTPLMAGMTDGCAAQVGSGCLEVGDWHSVIGTTLVLKGVADRVIESHDGAVYSHRLPGDSLWLPGGASNLGAGTLTAWLPGADLGALAATMNDPVTEHLMRAPLIYPLAGRGERFPFVDGNMIGSLLATSDLNKSAAAPFSPAALRSSEPALLYLAVIMGVAFVERLAFDRMRVLGAPLSGILSSSGGGTTSALWTRLRASTMGVSIEVSRTADAAFGTAILAAWGSSRADTGEESRESLPVIAQRLSGSRHVVDPDPAVVPVMESRFAQFRGALESNGWLGS